MKKLTALALAALLALSVLAGCSLNPQTQPSGAPADPDRDVAVITVGDQIVTMGEYMDLFDTYSSYYTNYGYDIFSDEASFAEFQDFVIDMLAEEKVLAHQAAKAGITEIGEEKLAEIEASVADELEYLLESHRAQAESEAAVDPSVDVEARAQELLAEESEFYTGSAMSYDEFVNWIRDYYLENAIGDLFREKALQGVTVDQAALQAWYDEALAGQQADYEENGGAYKIDAESFERYGGAPVVYAPAGYSRVLHILIAPEEAPGEEYTAKKDEMDALAAEYGALAFDAAIGGQGNPRLQEIVTAYKALEKELAALDESRTAPALKTANEAYEKLQTGGEFAAVMAEYTQDSDMLGFETLAKAGLLISNKYESEMDWSKAVKTAFSTLQIGQYSQVIQDEAGCHILYYLADEPAGPVALDAVKADAEALLLLDLQEQEWAAMLETWKNDGSVVINEELAHSYTGAVG